MQPFAARWVNEKIEPLSGFPAQQFLHDPAFWAESLRCYRAELRSSGQMQVLKELVQEARSKTSTLVCRPADKAHKQAVV